MQRNVKCFVLFLIFLFFLTEAARKEKRTLCLWARGLCYRVIEEWKEFLFR